MTEFLLSKDADLPWSVRIFRWLFLTEITVYSALIAVEKWVEVFS